MASKFEWFKTWLENVVKPLLSNKKFVYFLMCALLGTGVYTGYDLTGNQLGSTTSPATPKTTLVEDDKPEIVTIKEKVLQPIVNCNGDARVIRDHVKEHH